MQKMVNSQYVDAVRAVLYNKARRINSVSINYFLDSDSHVHCSLLDVPSVKS